MDKIKIKVDTLINMFECYLNERWVTLYDKDNEPYHVDLDKKSKNKEKKEPYLQKKDEYMGKLSKEVQKTFPFKHKMAVLDAILSGELSVEKAQKLHGKDYPEINFKKYKEDFEKEQKRQKELEEQITKKIKDIEDKKIQIKKEEDNEKIRKWSEQEKRREKNAKIMTFEDYFKTYYSQYKLSKRSPVYDLARGEWEEAQNK